MKKNVIGTILFFILLLGILVNIYIRVRNSSGSFSFGYFLDLVSSYEGSFPNFTFRQFTISNSWGIFDFLRVFVEFIGNALSLVGFLAINLVDLLRFILHFVVGFFSL